MNIKAIVYLCQFNMWGDSETWKRIKSEKKKKDY